MEATLQTPTAPASSRVRWAGRIVTALPTLFLAFDATIKLTHIQPVTEAMERLGFPDRLSVPLGFVEVALLALYLIPRTSVLGTVLWTGYLGGAIAIHARIGDPLASHTLFPIYVAAFLWAGAYLRAPRLRAFVRDELRR